MLAMFAARPMIVESSCVSSRADGVPAQDPDEPDEVENERVGV